MAHPYLLADNSEAMVLVRTRRKRHAAQYFCEPRPAQRREFLSLRAACLGIPEDVALRGAGWASTQADPGRAKQLGHWWGAPPYGDDPDDQVQIELGYNYVRLNCHQ